MCMENLPTHHLNTLNIVPQGEDADVGDGTIFSLLQAEAKTQMTNSLEEVILTGSKKTKIPCLGVLRTPICTLCSGIQKYFPEVVLIYLSAHI